MTTEPIEFVTVSLFLLILILARTCGVRAHCIRVAKSSKSHALNISIVESCALIYSSVYPNQVACGCQTRISLIPRCVVMSQVNIGPETGLGTGTHDTEFVVSDFDILMPNT